MTAPSTGPWRGGASDGGGFVVHDRRVMPVTSHARAIALP